MDKEQYLEFWATLNRFENELANLKELAACVTDEIKRDKLYRLIDEIQNHINEIREPEPKS